MGNAPSPSRRAIEGFLIRWLLALCLATLTVGCQTPSSIGTTLQSDPHIPLPWRPLSSEEQSKFDLGYATFNTEWAPANKPAGRTDGLGPLFNAQSCDACHNSRRRGRGPRGDGEAPSDLVMQLGKRLPDGSVQRAIAEYGRVLNTAAVSGFTREAAVSIHYEEQSRTLPDGSQITLRVPHYEVTELSHSALPSTTVLMPRMPPSIQGVGLLERVPQSELVALAKASRGRVAGRFGWQATEATVADQTTSALSREMGLTTALVDRIDCGEEDGPCLTAPNGGSPEVQPVLFEAVVFFQEMHAVPVATRVGVGSEGERTFKRIGCGGCHRVALAVNHKKPSIAGRLRVDNQVIHAYTDLLLHRLGPELADRDIEGNTVDSEWRTAPLWGMQAAVATGQPLRLLHDGRARSIEEAILWHGGEANAARERFMRLSADDRRTLAAWISAL